MQINELAKKTGLTVPTIRFYEKEGLLDVRAMCSAGRTTIATIAKRRLSIF